MDPDPPNLHPNPPKRNRIDQHREESSSRNEEFDPLLIASLPNELIVEILLRLPAKSLGKFKCISRSWFSLISSRGFIKAHLAIASESDDYSHHGLLFVVGPPNSRIWRLKQCSVKYVMYAPTAAATSAIEITDIDHPMKCSNRSFRVLGSCDGLVCIFSFNVNVALSALFMWNPCIKESKKLPDPGIEKHHLLMSGFGYDKLNDDYKVVCSYWDFINDGTVETRFKVYSLKNNSWHQMDFKIVNQTFVKGDSGNCPCVSGKLHWSVFDDIGSRKIGSIDLKNETYEEMDQPNSKDCDMLTLGVVGGCLSIVYTYEKSHADVWVMKEYGVKDSWTKVASISYIDHPGQKCRPEVVCLLRNGEILLVLEKMLLLYNPKSNTCKRYPQTHPIVNNVHMYVESLVSPNAID